MCRQRLSSLGSLHLCSWRAKKRNMLTYAHSSRWSIGHLWPLTIALCSGLHWPFQTSWSLAVSALLQCLTSNCCEAGLLKKEEAGNNFLLAGSGRCECMRSYNMEIWGKFSSSHSSENSSLLNEGGSASQVPQATVELAGYATEVSYGQIPFLSGS